MIEKISKSQPDSIYKLSIIQLEAHIRRVSKNTAHIIFTEHLKVQMLSRDISLDVVLDVLRQGKIIREPEPNSHKGSLECRMERFVAGESRKVIVALSDEHPNLIIVTVF